MYTAVYDAVMVTVKAMEKFLTSKAGREIMKAHVVDKLCPLRNMRNKDNRPGQRILNEIKQVCPHEPQGANSAEPKPVSMP